MKLTTKELLLAALFSALTIVGAKINFLLPDIPVTLQPVIVILAGSLIGKRAALLSQISYIIIGLAGIPVFAKPIAGPTYIIQPSFGYLLGFVAAAYIIGLIIERFKRKSFLIFISASMTGLMLIYIVGILYFYILMNMYLGKSIGIIPSVVMMVPFFIKDVLLGAVTSLVTFQIYHRVKSYV